MTYQTRKENKLNRILRQNTKTQVRTTERAEKKAAKQPSPVILKNVSAVKLFIWLFGAMIIGIVALVLIGGGRGENQSTSTTPAEGVTSDALHTSCAQWRAMSASDQSTMASSIISSEQAGGHAKGMSSAWLAANVTASCGGSKPSIPAGVSNSTVGQMAALIIYDVTVNPHAEAEGEASNH
jgi:hypothetical protein